MVNGNIYGTIVNGYFISAPISSIPMRGRRRPHRFSRASVYAIDCRLTLLARYSSTYESSNRSHRLIAAPPDVMEINNMTSNMTSLEAAMSPEPN